MNALRKVEELLPSLTRAEKAQDLDDASQVSSPPRRLRG